MNTILKSWIELSLFELFNSNDIDLINRGLKEECINHRLACHLERLKPEEYSKYYIDIEYDQNGLMQKTGVINGFSQGIRPDILVHKRVEVDCDNLVAFECKKNYLNRHDKQKLLWLQGNGYNYKVCIGIGYLPHEDTFLLYESKNNYQRPKRILKKICKM